MQLEDQRTVEVRLEDLCAIASAVGTIMGNLHNGKWKHLKAEIGIIHEVTERWANDRAVLGGGCHDDHRCGPCTSLHTPFHPGFGGWRGMSAEAAPTSTDMIKRRYFDNGEAGFLLFPVSEFVTRVMYRDQEGYVGVVAGWDISEAYTHTRYSDHVSPDGIEGFVLDTYRTPDAALIELCSSMMEDENDHDSTHLAFEELKDAAGDVLGQLVEELTA